MFGFFRRRDPDADTFRAADAMTEDDDVADVLRACRARIGPPPRALGRDDADAMKVRLTPEVSESFRASRDPMLAILADNAKLRDRGTVVWGQLVQANQLAFDPANPHTLPANVIYSLDPHFDGRPALLERMARGLFAKKGSVPADRELREFVRVVTDERERIMRRRLPTGYCGGRVVYFTTCFVQPSHFPAKCLKRPTFPLLVNSEETEAVMLLPCRFWPDDLVATWR